MTLFKKTHFEHDGWHRTDEGCDLRSRHLDSIARWLWLPGRRFHLADERFTLAIAFRIRGKVAPAEANYRHTLRLLEGRPRPLRSKELLRRHSLIAACHNHLGMMWLEHGPAERAAAAFDEAISYRRNLLRHFPKDRENQVYLGGALCNRGHAAADSDPTSAAVFYHESLQILRQPPRPVTVATGMKNGSHGGVPNSSPWPNSWDCPGWSWLPNSSTTPCEVWLH